MWFLKVANKAKGLLVGMCVLKLEAAQGRPYIIDTDRYETDMPYIADFWPCLFFHIYNFFIRYHLPYNQLCGV